ncbi:MAG TPA: hypothetical protein VGM77_11250 [Gemmatimonadales bacterium]|jgi:hypothetical protein
MKTLYLLLAVCLLSVARITAQAPTDSLHWVDSVTVDNFSGHSYRTLALDWPNQMRLELMCSPGKGPNVFLTTRVDVFDAHVDPTNERKVRVDIKNASDNPYPVFLRVGEGGQTAVGNEDFATHTSSEIIKRILRSPSALAIRVGLYGNKVLTVSTTLPEDTPAVISKFYGWCGKNVPR